jgi:hypothetical protein
MRADRGGRKKDTNCVCIYVYERARARPHEAEREGEGEKPSSDGWMDVILTVATATQCPTEESKSQTINSKERITGRTQGLGIITM